MVDQFVDGDKQLDRQLYNVRFSLIVLHLVELLMLIVLHGDQNVSLMELNA